MALASSASLVAAALGSSRPPGLGAAGGAARGPGLPSGGGLVQAASEPTSSASAPNRFVPTTRSLTLSETRVAIRERSKAPKKQAVVFLGSSQVSKKLAVA